MPIKFSEKKSKTMELEKPADIEVKYQRLAAEYSKVRSQASVLKKAVLEEQARNGQLVETVKKQEQTIRKHDQEMESLIFRNEQLTKRIAVLQQELQENSHNKKVKSKTSNNVMPSDTVLINEELQKKILENAHLLSSISDKDVEIVESKEKIKWLEEKLRKLENELTSKDFKDREAIEHLKSAKNKLERQKIDLESELKNKSKQEQSNEVNDTVKHWQNEAEKWKCECELLKSKPSSNTQLTEYYESQIRDITEIKVVAQSEASSLWAENSILNTRLEHLTIDNLEAQKNLEKSLEELRTTNENYRSQLDAMTEHLAAQNEKITHQCDEIQLLKHKLATKK